MRYEKKFQEVGGTNMIIVPAQWIVSTEKEYDKKMIGVYLDINDGGIQLTPMWGEKEVK